MPHMSRGRWAAVLLVLVVLVLGGVTYRIWAVGSQRDEPPVGQAVQPDGSDQSAPAASDQPDSAEVEQTDPPDSDQADRSLPTAPDRTDEPEADQTELPDADQPEPSAPTEVEQPEEPTSPSDDRAQDLEARASRSTYDFSQPAPQREAVDNSYFADAAFVGDSRTDGFLIYSGIGQGKNLTSNGLSIFKLAEKKALTIQGKSYTLLEALALEQYGKVYLSLGVNELGYYNDAGFYRSYCQAIDEIRALQPNAVIYIQGLIPLNETVIAQTSGRTYLTNEHLRVYNDLMRQAAQEKQVVFLDLYSAFVDENGELPAEASQDGVHLRSAWCKQWLAYLQTHTVDYETLYPTCDLPSEPAGSETE